MPENADFNAVFARLKQILEIYAPELKIEHDVPGRYHLVTNLLGPNKQPIWFGGVEIKKNYVSYHLIPVYMFPDILDSVSDSLKRRMQGKSCFNFKKLDEPLMSELADLTRRGFERVKQV
ncbi:MAG: hypothetical protein BroJett038_02130 [Chloroflexota bacterium]|nr:MAG: hypothetical protein BroJett038_02130 [Chloroflexota bacterium]